MGMFKKRSHYLDGIIKTVDPDPNRFRVQRVLKVGLHWVSIVNYPTCSTYEGKKLLVTTFDPLKVDTLDPHFNENGTIVARFLPTDDGWKMAIKFAKECL